MDSLNVLLTQFLHEVAISFAADRFNDLVSWLFGHEHHETIAAQLASGDISWGDLVAQIDWASIDPQQLEAYLVEQMPAAAA